MIEFDPVMAGLAAQLHALVSRLLAGSRDVALVDFPNHQNIGDAAIWLGEMTLLRSLNVRVRYACDQRSYRPEQLRSALPHGVVLLHGGGNFGDLYPRHQRLRERVVADFPDRRVIQMPLSIAGASEETVRRCRPIFDCHPDLTFLLREGRSLEWFRGRFACRTGLAPDAATCLGNLRRPGLTDGRPLWLARQDREATGARDVVVPDGFRCQDWPGQTRRAASRRLVSRVSSYAISSAPTLGSILHRPTAEMLYGRLASERVRAGVNLLSGAPAVVTDRLHGHILATLCGRPNVLLDNSTGKVRSYHGTWTHASPLVHWAETREEAWRLAREMVA